MFFRQSSAWAGVLGSGGTLVVNSIPTFEKYSDWSRSWRLSAEIRTRCLTSDK